MDEKPVRNTEPVDPLGHIANEMFTLLPNGIQAIVMLSDPETQMRVVALQHYDEDVEAIADLVMHFKALAEANGKQIDLMFLDEDGAIRW